MRNKTYRTVARYESRSRQGRFYEVKIDDEGIISCNCPAWVFKSSGERACKHTKAYLEDHEEVPAVNDIYPDNLTIIKEEQ